MDILKHNRVAWDQEVADGNGATIPVSDQKIADVLATGRFALQVGDKQLPWEWFADVRGKEVLCLASGGGQQAPMFAAAGAKVTLLDNSPLQLQRDGVVARNNNLNIHLVLGDMRDLSAFDCCSFDLVFNGFSNCYVEDVLCIWKECYRVLRKGGHLISTFWNPVNYLFDNDLWEKDGTLKPTYSIPYSDLTSLPKERLEQHLADHWPIEFGHSLQQQIGGQIAAGFSIIGYLESRFEDDLLSRYMDTVITTRTLK